jgi:hypothetical protein
LRPCGDPFLDLVSKSCSAERDALVAYMLTKSPTLPDKHRDFSFRRVAASTEQDLNMRYQTIPACHVCTNCGVHPTRDLKMQRCSGCGIVCYCSRECQMQSWRNEHKVECRAMKVPGDMNEYIQRIEKRLHFKLSPVMAPHIESGLAERCFQEQQSASRLREKTNRFVCSQDKSDFTLPPWIERTSVTELESQWILDHS